MKYKDWSDWRVVCSSISEIMVRPNGARPITASDRKKLEKLIEKNDRTPVEDAFIAQQYEKEQRFLDPELSATAIKHLIRRYSWEKYHKRVVSVDFAKSAARKGSIMEESAIEIISKLDKRKYSKEKCTVTNDYLIGVCDVFHAGRRKIIDVKASWNIYTFMPNHLKLVDKSNWFQMQGYMELYDADFAELCFVLVNTPIEIIQLEEAKLSHRFQIGEITKEKFLEGIDGLSHAFSYDKIPIKRRVIRQIIPRYKDIIPLIYRNVDKCRVWLNDFERIHTENKSITISPDRYVNFQKDDNSEPDTSDPC